MLSYGEVFLTLAAAAALFGPKDIPIVARAAGKFVGRAVGYIQSARGQLDDVMKRSQVDQVHKELQETMAQLEAIRYEIRNGMSMSNPGPITRNVLNIDLKPDSPSSPSTQTQAVIAGVKGTPTIQSNNVMLSATQGPVSETQELHRASLQPEMSHKTTSTTITSVKPVSFQPGPDGTFSTMPPVTARITTQRIGVKPVGVPPSATPQLSPNTREVMQDITVLPISAVSAGLLPARTGPLSGGADLVLESVTERKVAFDTNEFLRQTDPTLI